MELALDIASGVLMTLGLLLTLTGSVGVLRMPDFYSRLHPAGKSESLAQLLIISALALQASDGQVVVKLGLLSVLLFLTSPTATHAITKAARLDGLLPWIKPGDAEAKASRELTLSAPEELPHPADTVALYHRLHAMAGESDEESSGAASEASAPASDGEESDHE